MARSLAKRTTSSNEYLWLMVGAPCVAFIIAAAPALQQRTSSFPVNSIVRGMSGLILQALPFVLLGVVVSAAVETWVDADMIARHLPHRRSTAMLVAALSGAVVPICDCVVAPTFSKLLKRGLPLPVAVTFLCAAPILNPISLVSTWYAFPHNHMMVAARAGLGLATALAAGYAMAILPPGGLPLRENDPTASASSCTHTPPKNPEATVVTYLRHIHDDFLTLMPLVLIGVAIATVVRVSLGDNPASGLSATTTIVAMLAMMAFAYLGSICSSTDAVIAASLASVIPAPALLAFLVFGPMMDVKNTLMLMSACTGRFTARLIATIAVLAFLICAITIPLTEGLL
ncbi:permease [uncultured Bifidobacterium sp.]|uniref:permease n=1 Tax=uncultured Bifidobacterium sp. TaxID=165187 RepID=UPI002617B49F|nr:permease [uncultured Bifidobacterium sp.]